MTGDFDLCPVCETAYGEEGSIGAFWVRSCEPQGTDLIEDDDELFAVNNAHVTHHWDARTGELLPWVQG